MTNKSPKTKITEDKKIYQETDLGKIGYCKFVSTIIIISL